MRRLYAFILRALALPVLLSGTAARADTPIALWKAFDGRVNFTGTQVTLRTKPNSTNKGNNNTAACAITPPGTDRTAYLGVPLGATVLSAQLYWAGSGTMDSTVKFDNQDISAGRKYSSGTVGGGFDYFGGAADVTAIVKAKGSGTYRFSGLTVANGAPWCAAQGVLGGFSLLVVYSHPTEPERVLNVYEGFRYVQNGEVIVNASNFRWNRSAYPVKEKARIGHISWEGDPTLAEDGERLLFEGTEMTDSYNPEGNQFNSRSNINRDNASYGIDFDAYDTSVTVWAGYDAAVTTRYRTGQDMVILNAEVLVVPTMPVSDLSIALKRNNALQVGGKVQYTVTVSNLGPYTEAGPITVSNALPEGMSYVSGGGSGWTCSGSATAGSCTYRGKLAPGESAPALNVTAAVTTAGDKTNTVTVQGTDDDNLDNNKATDTATAPVPPSTPTPPQGAATLSYALTDSACTAGHRIGSAEQSCKPYSAPTVGGAASRIYITALVDGVPNIPNKAANTDASLQFRLECVNPLTGKVGASFAGATDIPACPSGEDKLDWSSATTVTFTKDELSVPRDFLYKDVGKIRLHVRTETGSNATEEFVSAPWQIVFKSISNGKDANQGHTKGKDRGFAAAGTPLTLEIRAQLKDGSYALNFGNESGGPALMLGREAVPDPEVKLVDLGAISESGTPSWKDGIRTSTAAWSEVGAINFVVGLGNPDPDKPGELKQDGLYFGSKVSGSSVPVGRFYPAYFKTIPAGKFNCPANLDAEAYPCPRTDNGAVYSGQGFDVAVEAYNAENKRVKNFTGDWFKTITLHAVKEAGGELLATDFTPPAGTAATTITATTAVPGADGKTSTDQILGSASYTLADPYSNKAPRAAKIGDPLLVHVRAVAKDVNPAGDDVEISSKRTAVPPALAEASDEWAVLVLNGRLAVPNALGTDILPTALGLRAEFWAGAKHGGWLLNRFYTEALAASGDKVTFLVCSANFAKADKTCDTNVVGPMSTKGAIRSVKLAGGAGTLWLRAPGKLANGVARTGSVTLQFDGWTWLPSTIGRVSFGSHRSPVIYVREMYF